MTLGIAFWVLMLLWLVLWWVHPPYSTLVVFVLFALLGWKVFGPALRP